MRKKLALTFFLLAILVLRGDLPVGEGTVEGIARPYSFNIASWEVEQFLSKGFFTLLRFFPAFPLSSGDKAEVVRNYFALGREIRVLKVAESKAPGSALELKAELAAKEKERDKVKGQAEWALEREVSRVLEEENLFTSVGPWFRILFPPVDFQFGKPPSVFIISPREIIRLEKIIILRPNLTSKEVEAIERRAEALGWSALVEPSGGFSTYPTIIPEDASLDFAFSTIVHEWLHSYFFFRPLGRHYFDSSEMRTINETAADIGGKEIGNRVLKDFRREEPVVTTPREGFDFNKEMRQTRLRVDELLAGGKVAEAEGFLEERRQFLAQHGYYIRRLNQAYFAFHGTYGTNPASVSPIGGYLERLRGRNRTVGEFLKAVALISRYEELVKLVEEAPR